MKQSLETCRFIDLYNMAQSDEMEEFEHRLCVKIMCCFKEGNKYIVDFVNMDRFGPRTIIRNINLRSWSELKKEDIINSLKLRLDIHKNITAAVGINVDVLFYVLFFKYAMIIKENGLFALNDSVKTKEDMYRLFSPSYKPQTIERERNNLIEDQWEKLKRNSGDEFDLSFFEHCNVQKILDMKNKSLEQKIICHKIITFRKEMIICILALIIVLLLLFLNKYTSSECKMLEYKTLK